MAQVQADADRRTSASTVDGGPNPVAGMIGLAVVIAGMVAFLIGVYGPSWAVLIGIGMIAVGAVAALYFFTDARPTVRRLPPVGVTRQPFCPYCGRPRRPIGTFCHTCGQRS